MRGTLMMPLLITLAVSPSLYAGPTGQAASVPLTPGMIVTSSIRITKSIYAVPAPASLDSAVVTVKGDNITIDFEGATLEGMNPDADPDLASGVGLRIEGGKNIHIRHANIRGYRFGIMARGVDGLYIDSCDVSYSWKPRLFSGIEHESLVDWLSFHLNDSEQWRRYGAGIYLYDVHGGEIKHNSGWQGMNGLLLTRCGGLQIVSNDFSFNSGVGIGLYRSSKNSIIHNKVDYNVRGYSNERYSRGQDSGDILLYEQSDSNVIAYNSATHGGDGLFIWAGQTTMDSGTGGVNDNLVYKNNFSNATANGIEATFSRNTFVSNLIIGNTYGVWGGYSFNSLIGGNIFVRNKTGIAIEHGQDNTIEANMFAYDTTAISLWANPITAQGWGYPKSRDTRSRGYRIEDNNFNFTPRAIKGVNTDSIIISGNTWIGVDSTTILKETTHVDTERNTAKTARYPSAPKLPISLSQLAPKVPAAEDSVPATNITQLDRPGIIVDEWGPYDWKAPKLVPIDGLASDEQTMLKLVGPVGKWKLADKKGVASISKTSGAVGDTILVKPLLTRLGGVTHVKPGDSSGAGIHYSSSRSDWEITLAYTGLPVISSHGEQHSAAEGYRVSYGRFSPGADWEIHFFNWTDSTDPRTNIDAFNLLMRSNPITTVHTPHLDYEWYFPTVKGISQEKFAAEARTSIFLADGNYTLRTISDDGIRVWVDGDIAVDNWSPHESQVDNAPLKGGTHSIRVLYYQVDGYTEFRVEIVKGDIASKGSPAPHGN